MQHSNAQKVISSYSSQKSEAELAYTGFEIIIASLNATKPDLQATECDDYLVQSSGVARAQLQVRSQVDKLILVDVWH